MQNSTINNALASQRGTLLSALKNPHGDSELHRTNALNNLLLIHRYAVPEGPDKTVKIYTAWATDVAQTTAEFIRTTGTQPPLVQLSDRMCMDIVAIANAGIKSQFTTAHAVHTSTRRSQSNVSGTGIRHRCYDYTSVFRIQNSSRRRHWPRTTTPLRYNRSRAMHAQNRTHICDDCGRCCTQPQPIVKTAPKSAPCRHSHAGFGR
jgi:hypothetical protein